MFITFLRNAIRFSTIFLFGSTGETIVEKSGHLNMGIPGVMCIGALAGCAGMSIYFNTLTDPSQINLFGAVVLGILFTIISGAICGVIFSFFTVTLRCNQNITGLTLTTLGAGINLFVFKRLETFSSYFGKASDGFRNLFQVEVGANWFTDVFLSYGILVYLAIIIAVVTTIIFSKTRVGLNLKAVGESPATADSAGISVTRYRYLATIIGCSIASLGGLFMIMDYLGGNIEYGLDEYGWLAVAIVIFSMWKPHFGILASFIFGALYIAPSYLNVSFAMKNVIKMIPYVVTIAVLVVTSILNKKGNQPPEGLGINYDREKR